MEVNVQARSDCASDGLYLVDVDYPKAYGIPKGMTLPLFFSEG